MFETMIGIGRVPQATLDISSDPGDDPLRVRVGTNTQLRVLANTGVTIGGNPGNAPTNGLYVNGFTGMGTTSPSEKLQVNGAIRLNGSASSENPAAGTMRWNPTTVDFEGYDGTQWESLTGLAGPLPPPTYEVGDYEDQGVVFWVSPDGKTVKFVYIAKLAYDRWANPSNIDISGAESNLDGLQNSKDIKNDPNVTSSAAEICLNLNAAGISDWYMPAINEVVELNNVKGVVNQTISANLGDTIFDITNLTHDWVWSSSEQNSSFAEVVKGDGTFFGGSKTNNEYQLRAVRTVTFP